MQLRDDNNDGLQERRYSWGNAKWATGPCRPSCTYVRSRALVVWHGGRAAAAPEKHSQPGRGRKGGKERGISSGLVSLLLLLLSSLLVLSIHVFSTLPREILLTRPLARFRAYIHARHFYTILCSFSLLLHFFATSFSALLFSFHPPSGGLAAYHACCFIRPYPGSTFQDLVPNLTFFTVSNQRIVALISS